MKKRTKVILVVVAVVLGISAGGYFLYDAQERQDEDKLRKLLAKKMREAIDMGDYETARVYLELRRNLKHSLYTDMSEDTFEYLHQRYQLFIEAGESLEAGNSLKCAMYLDSINVLDASYEDAMN